MALVEIQLLGVPRVVDTAAAKSVTLPERALAVVTYAVLNAAAPIKREKAAFALWPDDAEDLALANLRRALYALNQLLPAAAQPWIFAQRRTLQWNARCDADVDVLQFERFLDAGCLEEAVAVYAGDLLTDLEAEWIAAPREALRNRYLDALDRLVAVHRTADPILSMKYARQALQCDPWHETAAREMIALRASIGDRAGAQRELNAFTTSLRSDLGVEPSPQTQHAVHEPPQRPRFDNLPAPVTSFVGRSAELDDVAQLCRRHRLVTLVGPGGVGKTRLAIACAQRLTEEFSQIRLADLTTIGDEHALLRTIARVLKIRDVDRTDIFELIAQTLEPVRALLVLDNCEGVLHDCSSLALELLEACPNLTVLATSREALSVAGGAVYDVPPLVEPESIELMAARVAAAYPHFKLQPEAELAVASICRRLDGIPLAIELAASHARTLSPQEILERLEDRFALLSAPALQANPHHQTLRGALDWSYDMLEDRQAKVLRALSVFRGTFDARAVASVCGMSTAPEALAVLEQLVEKSFLQFSARGSARFRLLETIREYLREKLQAAKEDRRTCSAHLRYYAGYARELAPQLTTGEQTSAMRALRLEEENIRAALDLRAAMPEERAMQLAMLGDLAWYYWFYNDLQEGFERSTAALQSCEERDAQAYARAHITRALCARELGDLTTCLESAGEALQLLERYGDEARRPASVAALVLATAHLFTGDTPHARAAVRRAVEAQDGSSVDGWLIAYECAVEALCLARDGDIGASIALLERAIEVSAVAGERYQRAYWVMNLAVQQFEISPLESARSFLESCEDGVRTGNERIIAGSLEGFGWCLSDCHEWQLAAHVLGAARALREKRRLALLPQWHASHERAISAIRAATSAEFVEMHFGNGAAWAREAPSQEICAQVVPRVQRYIDEAVRA